MQLVDERRAADGRDVGLQVEDRAPPQADRDAVIVGRVRGQVVDKGHVAPQADQHRQQQVGEQVDAGGVAPNSVAGDPAVDEADKADQGDGAGDPSGSTAAVESLTGLEPLPRDAWIAGLPTFAALILADDAGALATDLAVFASELAARVASHADYSSEAPAPLADMLGWGASSLLLLTPQDAGATSTTTTVSAPTDSVEDRPATAEPATPRRTWLAEAHVPLRAGAGERLAIVVIVLGPAVAQ